VPGLTNLSHGCASGHHAESSHRGIALASIPLSGPCFPTSGATGTGFDVAAQRTAPHALHCLLHRRRRSGHVAQVSRIQLSKSARGSRATVLSCWCHVFFFSRSRNKGNVLIRLNGAEVETKGEKRGWPSGPCLLVSSIEWI
jgi:hypothetical protein